MTRRHLLLAFTTLALGCQGSHTITGTVDVIFGCSYAATMGRPHYPDIRQGAQVVVKDQGGAVIATGQLGERNDFQQFDIEKFVATGKRTNTGPPWCRMAFSVPNVPRRDFYAIEVGHRGGLNYSFADMEKRGWKVEFQLGNENE